MTGAYCPECREPMHMAGSGFYFHDSGLPLPDGCTLRATLDPVNADGEYPNGCTCGWAPRDACNVHHDDE